MRSVGLLGLSLMTCAPVVAAQVPGSKEAAATAQREGEPHPWRARPFAIDAVVGIASPVGLSGLTAEYAPLEALSLGAGAGTNLFGWQLAGMLRWRLNPEQRSSWFFGAGYSQGAHHQQRGTQEGVFSLFTAPLASMGEANTQVRDWPTARWLNAEFGIEGRGDRGFDRRTCLGLAILLNTDDNVLAPKQDEYDRPIKVRTFMIYWAAALGYAI